MTPAPRIIVGEARTRILRDFGFDEALLHALHAPEEDPLTAAVLAGDGSVLAEIAGLPGVDGALPPGRIVPVCHVERSQLHYVLLLEQDGGWLLVDWSPEHAEPIGGGLVGWLTDLIVRLWEEHAPEDEALAAWGTRMGHPAAARAVRERAAAEPSMGTAAGLERWRRAFLASLG